MVRGFHFAHTAVFRPETAAEILAQLPAAPGVFALAGADDSAEPYLSRAADLRRRAARLLAPPQLDAAGAPVRSRRLNLRDRVHAIHWTPTGSEFESLLVLSNATAAVFGAEQARRRLRLHTPFCLRLTLGHAHPRLYVTNRLTRATARQASTLTVGPFASRSVAERFNDGVLDLFHLRRCVEDLAVHPDHPGCAWGEMKRCLTPCNTTCSADDYAAEARAVEQFLRTRGHSLLATIERQREAASEAMEFEAAAAAHERYTRVRALTQLAGDLVQPLPALRALIVLPAPHDPHQPDRALLVLVSAGCLYGPQPLSTLGVRAVREQTSVGSSLFAQPLMLAPVPLETSSDATPADSPEQRAAAAIAALENKAALEAQAAASSSPDPATLSDHLSLLRRWYYRPEKQRLGEIFFPSLDGTWPLRRILNGAARMALGTPRALAETNRAAAPAAQAALESALSDAPPPAKTRTLHPGREGVERTVPVFTSRRRRASAPEPAAPAPAPATEAAAPTPAGQGSELN